MADDTMFVFPTMLGEPPCTVDRDFIDPAFKPSTLDSSEPTEEDQAAARARGFDGVLFISRGKKRDGK